MKKKSGVRSQKSGVRSRKSGVRWRPVSRVPVLAGEETVVAVKKGRKGAHKNARSAERGRSARGGAVAPVRKLFGAAAAAVAAKAAREALASECALAERGRSARGEVASAIAAAVRKGATVLPCVEFLDLRVAVGEPRDGVYRTNRIDIQLSPLQARGIHRLLAGAQEAVTRLENGKLVGNVGDLVRWIAEQAV